MDAKIVFDAFLNDLKTSFPEIAVSEYSLEHEVAHLEDEYYPTIVKILQRDDTFFEEDRLFCGVNISDLWKRSETSHESIWKHLQICMIASFMHGDIKEKIGKLVGTFKTIWNSSGQENDEINRILNDEKSEDYLREILDFVTETRLAKIFMQIVEEFDISDLEINFENPQEFIDVLKNPENPIMKKVITRIQTLIQRKVERGEFTQQQLVSEIEGIKAKVTSLFGNIFNDALGGRRADVPATVLMGNSPEARRQRMLARLQRKQREKNSH
jgi:hypothetical protein